ncbi:MAG: hypothetical protein P8X74_19245 [Reinekea sp.]
MFFKDGSLYSYKMSNSIDRVLNIGWLSIDQVFSTGEFPQEFMDKLTQIICGNAKFDAHFNLIRGIRSCDFCNKTEVILKCGAGEMPLGMSEILIPHGREKGYFFAAPSLVVHYILEHGYIPPSEFIESVLAVNLTGNFNADEVFDNILDAS